MSTEQFNEPGYLWNMTLPLRAIHESGIRLKTDEWAIFFVMKAAIAAGWSEKHESDKRYAWVSAKHVKSQLRSLEDVGGLTDSSVYRKIEKLESAGLVTRLDEPTQSNRSFFALGPNADFLEYSVAFAETQDGFAKTRKQGSQKCESGFAKTRAINNIDNKENIEDNSLSPDVPPEEEKEVNIKSSEQGRAWYEKESLHVLKSPPENFARKDVAAAAAAIRPTPATPRGAAGGYRELCEWVNGKNNDAYPSGMKYVQSRPKPITFNQYCILRLINCVSRDTIMQYLCDWENKRYKHTNVYHTLATWARKDSSNPQVPAQQGGGFRPKAPANEEYSC